MPPFSPYWITAPVGLVMFGLVLYELRQKRHFAFTYAYGLALTGLHLGRDEENDIASVQLGLVLRNAVDGPLKYYVEHIDVIIGDRTLSHPTFQNRGAVIPRGSQTTFFYPPFTKDVVQPRSQGVIRFTILYGRPEIGFSRRMKAQLSFTLRLDDKSSIVYLTDSESDDKI